MLAKLKAFIKAYHSELTLSVTIVAITLISFNLGKMTAAQPAKLPLTILTPSSAPRAPRDQTVVASKAAGSKLYHFTWCSGAKRIAEKNKITFPNESAAISAGYTLAGNCQR